MVHPEVEGSVSLELNNVTIDDVLRVAREIYGYEYSIDHGIYTIYPRKLRTEVFPINYLDVKRVGVSDTSVVVGNINGSGSNNNNSNGNGNRGSGGGGDQANLLGLASENGNDGGNRGSNGGGFSAGSRVQTLSATDFWQSLRISLEAIVGTDQADRMVMVNSQTGVAVVKALPTELKAVRDFLDKSAAVCAPAGYSRNQNY